MPEINEDELDWDRDEHGGMVEHATDIEDEPDTCCAGEGDEEGEDD